MNLNEAASIMPALYPTSPRLPGPATKCYTPPNMPPAPPATPTGPYRVERVDTPDGPRWRLAGPGLEGTKAYPWEEFRDKLQEMAQLMNFAWSQARAESAAR
jgi:hypothetical protein